MMEARITNLELDWEFECHECHTKHGMWYTESEFDGVDLAVKRCDCKCGNLYIVETRMSVEIRMIGK